jgi:hypothetical protein
VCRATRVSVRRKPENAPHAYSLAHTLCLPYLIYSTNTHANLLQYLADPGLSASPQTHRHKLASQESADTDTDVTHRLLLSRLSFSLSTLLLRTLHFTEEDEKKMWENNRRMATRRVRCMDRYTRLLTGSLPTSLQRFAFVIIENNLFLSY